MDIKYLEEHKTEVSIILQMEQYKNVNELNEELLSQIIGFLKDSERKIDDYLRESKKPPKEGNIGPWIA